MLCALSPMARKDISRFFGIFQQLLSQGLMYHKSKKTCWLIRLTWVFSSPHYLENKSFNFLFCVLFHAHIN